jgi:putative ABC transport system permease protein
MKILRLLFKNVFRNRRRTILTVSSIAVSLFLVATLLTLLNELNNPPETPESALRLITRHKVSLATLMPLSYQAQISRVEGVEAVTANMWFGGIYKDPANFFPQMGVNPETVFDVAEDLQISEGDKRAFLTDRTGAVAGAKLAKRFGWNRGDKIHLQGTFLPVDLELTLQGIYEAPDESALYFSWDYLNESLGNFDQVGTYWIKAASADQVPAVAERIDALFQNTTAPTKTESEKAFVLSFISMMGNVQLLITSICSAVIFAIVLVAANTMAMSIRERTREIGIFKALGFRRSQLMSLLLAESVLIALGGALIGSWGARLVFSQLDMASLTGGFMQRFEVNPSTLVISAAVGILVGLVSAGVPAWQAARRPVVEALRSVV